MTTQRTRYQLYNFPVTVVSVKCTNTERKNGCCTACGRSLSRSTKHNPPVIGSLGWIETYADDSTYQASSHDKR